MFFCFIVLFFYIFATDNQINMSRKVAIKTYHQGQTIMFPESIDSYIAADSPVRLINTIVDQLDLSEVMESYSGGGCSSFQNTIRITIFVHFI